MDDDAPEEIRALVARREERRAARDFRSADELRERILSAGFELHDTPSGPVVRRASPLVRRIPPHRGRPVLDEPPPFHVPVQWVGPGWPQDAAPRLRAFPRP